MSKSRHIVAVMAVTTALLADQMVCAAPLSRPPVSQMAARLVERLSQPFRRAVPAQVRETARLQTGDAAVEPRHELSAQPLAAHVQLSPFQFRLPPPMA